MLITNFVQTFSSKGKLSFFKLAYKRQYSDEYWCFEMISLQKIFVHALILRGKSKSIDLISESKMNVRFYHYEIL